MTKPKNSDSILACEDGGDVVEGVDDVLEDGVRDVLDAGRPLLSDQPVVDGGEVAHVAVEEAGHAVLEVQQLRRLLDAVVDGLA